MVTAPRRVHPSQAARPGISRVYIGPGAKYSTPFRVRAADDQTTGRKYVVRYVLAGDREVATFDTCTSAASAAVDMYRGALLAGGMPYTVEDITRDLAGADLACWCTAHACHADVLLDTANTAPTAPATPPVSYQEWKTARGDVDTGEGLVEYARNVCDTARGALSDIHAALTPTQRAEYETRLRDEQAKEGNC